MHKRFVQNLSSALVLGLLAISAAAAADVRGVAPGIPEPQNRNVIVQLFNWPFKEVQAVLPQLRQLGYSHVHVSPPQKSNERVWQWWGRYQPIDFSVISGPLGGEADFQAMNAAAETNGIQIIADVVPNHLVDITEIPESDLVVLDNNNHVVSEKFAQFEPGDIRDRVACGNNVQECWLFGNLVDLKTENGHVRKVFQDYLTKLSNLGVDGFRFDAAKHIEPDFFPAVLSVVPNKYAFGEIIETYPDSFSSHLQIAEMDYYDFPLAATMREAFGYGGNLTILKSPQDQGRALVGTKAVTFVRNHDIDRGQAGDRGVSDATYGVGWDAGNRQLNRTDVNLAYAYILGREDGLPYVFADMPTLPADQKDDRYDDPDIVAGIRFHNLSLPNEGGVARRQDIFRIETPTVLGWQRGTDRFIVINKAADWYSIRNLQTSLQPGKYLEVRNGWPMHVQSNGQIVEWNFPPRSAMRFARVGN